MKPKKTQAEIDDERIKKQHMRAILGRQGWRASAGQRRSHNAFSATHRQVPYEKKVDESPDIG